MVLTDISTKNSTDHQNGNAKHEEHQTAEIQRVIRIEVTPASDKEGCGDQNGEDKQIADDQESLLVSARDIA